MISNCTISELSQSAIIQFTKFKSSDYCHTPPTPDYATGEDLSIKLSEVSTMLWDPIFNLKTVHAVYVCEIVLFLSWIPRIYVTVQFKIWPI